MNETDSPVMDETLSERLPGESNRAFMCFCVYRDLGPGRSIETAAQKLSKCKQILARYSTTFDWKKRTQKFDDAVDKAKIRAHLLEAAREGAKSAALWEARKQDTLEEFYQASVALKRAGDSILRCPIIKEVDGEKGEIVIEPIGRWALRDASVLMRTSIDIRTAIFEAATKSLDRLNDLELLAVAGMAEAEATGLGEPITSSPDQKQTTHECNNNT